MKLELQFLVKFSFIQISLTYINISVSRTVRPLKFIAKYNELSYIILNIFFYLSLLFDHENLL